jgi:hypothetical protein
VASGDFKAGTRLIREDKCPLQLETSIEQPVYAEDWTRQIQGSAGPINIMRGSLWFGGARVAGQQGEQPRS